MDFVVKVYFPNERFPEGGKVSGKLTVSAPDGFTQLYYLSGES